MVQWLNRLVPLSSKEVGANVDFPQEGSSVDAKPTETIATNDLGPATEDVENDSSASTTAVECTESQILSILAAAGQGVEDDDEEDDESSHMEKVRFTVIFKKQKHEVSWPCDSSISKLKSHIESLTGVPASLQKIMYKGLAKDEKTLRELNVVEGAKLMVIGSTLNDVLAVSAPSKTELQDDYKSTAKAAKEPLSEQKQHKKILDKYGKPEDVPVGIKGLSEALPQVPLSGMYNKSGGKVRLTFKLDSDQLWLGTKERTVKIPMPSIKAVTSEPIKGHEDYHIMTVLQGLVLSTWKHYTSEKWRHKQYCFEHIPCASIHTSSLTVVEHRRSSVIIGSRNVCSP
ncbi:ubiquitin domain-containing protein ubfd1-like [Plakobranchus ocellatus]|uniref:Ubiquitin domain-containing protein ubfd1-like n=1 Tax=Plakobranchus ocellatus TaxID=259542 RepID=A0AAV3YEY9_9GAST|nr:ubiquitin domain-containing protein ubfd1-like [Plakobranchus ocellatus]